jgi:IclR family acetate operon transcriptional repressor
MSVNEVKSAKRVLDILAFFAAEKAPASLARVSAALNYPKSSCLALFDTLLAEGYAYQIEGRYYLTARWLNEAHEVAVHDQVATRCRPTLAALQGEIAETLILARLAGSRVLYLDVIEPERVLLFAAHVGQTKPVHASASGRALLAALPPDERARVAAALDYRRFTPATPGNPKALLRDIDDGIDRGWQVNLGGHQADTLSIAAPFVLHGAALAFVVGAPMSRAAAKVAQIGAKLARAARRIEADHHVPPAVPARA